MQSKKILGALLLAVMAVVAISSAFAGQDAEQGGATTQVTPPTFINLSCSGDGTSVKITFRWTKNNKPKGQKLVLNLACLDGGASTGNADLPPMPLGVNDYRIQVDTKGIPRPVTIYLND